MAKINFANITFCGDTLQSVSEALYEVVFESIEISKTCRVVPNVVVQTFYGVLKSGGLVGVAGQGCDGDPQDWEGSARQVELNPKKWEIFLRFCWENYEDTVAREALNRGWEIMDLTDTEVADILVYLVIEDIRKFIVRLAWFSDTELKTQADGGELAKAADLPYFNVIDGFWKRIIEYATTNPETRVTIAENAVAGQELQISNAQKYLQQLVYKAPIELRNQKSGVILCTRSFYDAYELSLDGTSIETMYTNIVEGLDVITYKRIPLIPVDDWDYIIRSHFHNGTTDMSDNPHRAIYTNVEYLVFGVDAEDSFTNFLLENDKIKEHTIMKLKGTAATAVAFPDLVRVAI